MSDDMIRQRLWGKTDICALFTALKAMDRRYNAMPLQDMDFHLFLAECEWCFNFRSPWKGLQVFVQWANILIGFLI
ncbi:hypothetical protein [Komagataeibacter sp. FXV3]|uniref:hypothetical protein n=1 Tax=Komagataeibacter sp. FXV3 TaxID=2608998 RepID=UPI00187B9778|nr:hypothetical protein [Komagataeibacter sp. FXV3]MBE7728348.1 hypothetical protein [Komagataeibacter sp. FXV3]